MQSSDSGSKRTHAPDSIIPPSSRSKIKKALVSPSSPLLASDGVVHVSFPTRPQSLVSPLEEVVLPSSGFITPSVDTVPKEPSLVVEGSSLPSTPSCSVISLTCTFCELLATPTHMAWPCIPPSQRDPLRKCGESLPQEETLERIVGQPEVLEDFYATFAL